MNSTSSSHTAHTGAQLPPHDYAEKLQNLGVFFAMGNMDYIQRKFRADQLPHEIVLAQEFNKLLEVDPGNMCALFHMYAEDDGLRTNGIPAFLPAALQRIDNVACEVRNIDTDEAFSVLTKFAKLAQESFYLAIRCFKDLRSGAIKNPVKSEDADRIRNMLSYAADRFAEAANAHAHRGSPYDGTKPMEFTGTPAYNDGLKHGCFTPTIYVLEHFGKQNRSKASLIGRIEKIIAQSSANQRGTQGGSTSAAGLSLNRS